MASVRALLPPTDKGYLPVFLFVSAVAAAYSTIGSYTSLSATRRIYNGLFVPRVSSSTSTTPDDSVSQLVPVAGDDRQAAKAKDQVNPLAGRLFGVYTFVAGLLRIYGAYHVENPVAYQLALWGYVVAAVHFTSELLVYKTIRFNGPQGIPFVFASSGVLWMLLQYDYYTSSY
ncbi:hypothetical protein A1O3_02138 [Capronia epimyces CBS 606.96]|uniref:Ergosterol biosynthetic protein 28 n=1 Tax=Capronia epimyces CBS 606.96 TaxID=1182542 RepID=W9Z3J6_9EURO|nr:uncharacterized protein A1O3_02138 [Capronia epimyces CBS 606.96]EXJ89074.1 hypothetical protein A1O3_02138 [Capronia epimyces CBS 606.96]